MSSHPPNPHPSEPAPTLSMPGDGSSVASENTSHTSPVHVGSAPMIAVPGFTVERELGRGGMGVVYLCRQATPNRRIALKLVHAGTAASATVHERFRLEGEAVARLTHPGIVQVYSCGEANGVPYMVLEYIEGHTLEQFTVPPDPRWVAECVCEIAEAIAYAHARGIVHRDLKPGNVLMTTDGKPKVTDFGLAKFDPALAPTLEDIHATTRSGAILGSPRYMAPEQAAGRVHEIGPRTDVHAIGLILYELLTRQPAYDGDSLLDVLDNVRHREPKSIRLTNPAAPRDLETICMKCLAKDPQKRYATAEELVADLGRYLRGEPIHARPVPIWERGAKWAKRHPDSAIVWGLIWFMFPPTLVAVALSMSLISFAMGVFHCLLGVIVVVASSWWIRAGIGVMLVPSLLAATILVAPTSASEYFAAPDADTASVILAGSELRSFLTTYTLAFVFTLIASAVSVAAARRHRSHVLETTAMGLFAGSVVFMLCYAVIALYLTKFPSVIALMAPYLKLYHLVWFSMGIGAGAACFAARSFARSRANLPPCALTELIQP